MPKRLPPTFPSQNLALGFLLFLGLVALNAFLVSPYIGWYDSGEMIGTTLCLGISHPSGQALFHLLGKIFLLLPFSTPAFRLGFLSVVCSALASMLFWLLSLNLAEKLRKSPSPTIPSHLKVWLLLLTLAWSLSLPWWRYSVTPLVYALHLLFGLLILWALSLDRPGKWYLVFFLIGMATVFRPTQFFALPFLGAAYFHHLYHQNFTRWPRAKGVNEKPRKVLWLKTLIVTAVAFALGRSTLLYLPLRSALNPDIAYGDLTHPLALFRHVMALKFSKYVGTVTISTVGSVFTQMVLHLWNDLTPLGVALLFFGAILVKREWKKIPVFLWVGLGWGLLEALFVFTIPYPTFESHQVLLGWAYVGLLGALSLVQLEKWAKKEKLKSFAVGAVLVLFVLVQLVMMGYLLDRKKERGAQDYARNLLSIMEPHSVYYPAEENEYFPVVGYQQSFTFRKDVEALEPGASPSVVGAKIKECLEQGRALYVTRKWVLPPGWTYEGVGPLLKVVQQGLSATPKKISPGAQPKALWGKIGLMGVHVEPNQVQAGGKVEITYDWARRGPSACDKTDSVIALFVDDEGNYCMRNGVFWLHDIHDGPLGRISNMKPGYEYQEKRILFIPSDFPLGHYHFVVGLQKTPPPRQEGHEAFGKEFYERSGTQNLDKFLGRGETGAVVQFSVAVSDTQENSLWPVTKSVWKPMDARFAPVADLRITTTDK